MELTQALRHPTGVCGQGCVQASYTELHGAEQRSQQLRAQLDGVDGGWAPWPLGAPAKQSGRRRDEEGR